jgi:two-component system alkaline phosphatase synthesis response regulator PhoP
VIPSEWDREGDEMAQSKGGSAAVHEHSGAPALIEIADLRVYPDEYIATPGGERLNLTQKEFKLLVLFASRPGRLLTRKVIAGEVWGSKAPGRTIDVHVARLRNRLPKGAIETVVKIGYRFLLQP